MSNGASGASAAAPAAVKTTKAPPRTKAPSGPKTPKVDHLAKARAARDLASKNDVFKFRGETAEGVKVLPPQAQAIVNIIESHKKSGVTREALCKEMEGVVQTRQPQGRILAYYQKRLVDEGHVTFMEAPRPAKEEPEKAAA